MMTRLARCPACCERRNVDAQEKLRAAESAWRALRADVAPPFAPGEECMRALALRELPQWFWACDACLRAGRALAADPARQNLAMGTAFAAYVERPFRCEDCFQQTVFTPSEQKYWFEDLGFLVWVYPKQCRTCRHRRRKNKRAQKELQELLAHLDPADPTQLRSAARLYEELGADKKAAEMAARARNVERKGPSGTGSSLPPA